MYSLTSSVSKQSNNCIKNCLNELLLAERTKNLSSLTGSDWSGREVGVKIPCSYCVGYLMCISYAAIS